MKYKRKPETVDAFAFDENAEVHGPKWFLKAVLMEQISIDRAIHDGAVHVYGCSMRVGGAWMKAKRGDYIIRDSTGKISFCSRQEFRRKYEECEEVE